MMSTIENWTIREQKTNIIDWYNISLFPALTGFSFPGVATVKFRSPVVCQVVFYTKLTLGNPIFRPLWGESVCLSFTQVNIQSCQLFGEGANQYQFFKQSFSREIPHEKKSNTNTTFMRVFREHRLVCLLRGRFGTFSTKGVNIKISCVCRMMCNFAMFVFIESQMGK